MMIERGNLQRMRIRMSLTRMSLMRMEWNEFNENKNG